MKHSLGSDALTFSEPVLCRNVQCQHLILETEFIDDVIHEALYELSPRWDIIIPRMCGCHSTKDFILDSSLGSIAFFHLEFGGAASE